MAVKRVRKVKRARRRPRVRTMAERQAQVPRGDCDTCQLADIPLSLQEGFEVGGEPHAAFTHGNAAVEGEPVLAGGC